jgi:hypothetical protein
MCTRSRSRPHDRHRWPCTTRRRTRIVPRPRRRLKAPTGRSMPRGQSWGSLPAPPEGSSIGALGIPAVLIAISNGSACTSATYTLSHVLLAMGLSEDRIRGALRLSWCHLTQAVDWAEVCHRLGSLRG